MTITTCTIRAAFDRHHQHFATGGRAWDVGHHVDCWTLARRAFDGTGDFESFRELYGLLRGHWQVFRRAKGRPWTDRETYDQLAACDQRLRGVRLGELSEADLPRLTCVVDAMSGLKSHTGGPSVMALSKFLHFWNPRLFVIVDYAVMWVRVFGHHWLWDQVRPVRERVVRALPGVADAGTNGNVDVLSYLAILLWSGQLVRDNPELTPAFGDYLRQHVGRRDAGQIGEVGGYEAAAVEWLLLGLVELPPNGVHLESDA